MSNRNLNSHRRAMRPVTPVVRIGRHAAGAAITAGLLAGGGSVALADGQAPVGAESTGVTAAPQTAPAVAIPAAGTTASPAVYGSGVESAAASLSIKAKPVEKPKPVEQPKAEKAEAKAEKAEPKAEKAEKAEPKAEQAEPKAEKTNRSEEKAQAEAAPAAHGTARSGDSSDDTSEQKSEKTEQKSEKKASKKRSSDEPKAAAQESSNDAPAPAASGSSIVDTARSGIGVRYVSGGSTRSGWDCSGFTQWVYAQHGVSLTHSAAAQKSQGTVISQSEARPGDLVYTPGHVGIYAGNGTIIDAGNSKKDTTERKMWSASWTYVRVG